jgi:hypothetical protein
MNRLDTIAERQRSNRVRDALFAAFIVLAAAVGIAAISAEPTSSHVTQR